VAPRAAAEHPAGHPADLPDLSPPEIPPQVHAEPGSAQNREQGDRLDQDAQEGAEAKQSNAERRNCQRCLVQSHRSDVDANDCDDHNVVDDRRPHIGAEPALGVEDRAK
jgi:hypothetical protein